MKINILFSRVILGLTLLSLLVTAPACGRLNTTPGQNSQSTQTEILPAQGAFGQPAPVVLLDLSDLEYTLPLVAEALPETGGVARLVRGHFERQYAGTDTKLMVDLMNGALGDLDGDGREDGAAILVVDSGGSGLFMHLAAVVSGQDGLQQAGSILLGDRVKIEKLAIQDGVIALDLLVHGPDDPLCCASQKAYLEYILEGDQLLQR